jgi:hypothetical protein
LSATPDQYEIADYLERAIFGKKESGDLEAARRCPTFCRSAFSNTFSESWIETCRILVVSYEAILY